MHEPRTIGLALSGGGIRAAIFHLGVLRYLAEQKLLERISYISTVSGGSLLVGLTMRCAGYRWPSSGEFLSQSHQAIESVLLNSNLQLQYIARLFLLPWNWLRFAFRANVLADTISATWRIDKTLDSLPANPVWAINGTTMETGRRWRFRSERATDHSRIFEMGDGEIGYTSAAHFPIASAMATSAAFPGGISPLTISTHDRQWSKENFEKPDTPLEPVHPKYGTYHIADGGVYDNLGLEPLFDISRNAIRPKCSCDFLVVSDAGSPLRIRRWHGLAQLFGFSKRSVDVLSAQTRNLRVRAYVHFLLHSQGKGVFLDISQDSKRVIDKAKRETNGELSPALEARKFLSDVTVQKVALYPTTLWKPGKTDFDHIEQHGYEVAAVQFGLHTKEMVT